MQGYLDFYNSGDNWLSRCFTLEYAIWFRVVLLGVQRLGLPIPLGGTSVFFRRSVLERIGAWDAHNVTEDADLGMRLARFGYRCEMIASTTWEEANCRALAVDQASARAGSRAMRVTWATHMRRPRELWRDLGPRGFLGFQVLFLGAITSYLSLPLFWAIWTGADRLRPRLLAQLPGLADVELLRLDARRAGGDADDGGDRGARHRPAGAVALGAGAAVLLAARRGRGLARRSARSSPARSTGTRPSTGVEPVGPAVTRAQARRSASSA